MSRQLTSWLAAAAAALLLLYCCYSCCCFSAEEKESLIESLFWALRGVKSQNSTKERFKKSSLAPQEPFQQFQFQTQEVKLDGENSGQSQKKKEWLAPSRNC
jgi:hypothetical protein